MADIENETGVEEAPNKRSQRTALMIVGLVGVLAIGFALGFLVRLPFDDSSTPTPAADSVDVGFSQDMTVHHEQAVEMATIALTKSDDAAVKTLAYDILTSQSDQIGQMQGWLALWDMAPRPSGEFMTWMSEGGAESMHGGHGQTASDSSAEPATNGDRAMPGMATPAEMTALGQASGPELDVMFLQLMLRHHQGGLPMGEYAEQYANAPVVRNLATKMVDMQTGEANLMTSMLAERNAEPLPMN
ncbi:DUF305 domain-containing protein [Rhodococcus xishaensis]|uniref:DUF305 domain-containing protein n=1 Tax=Rhodococcus xishaensis TaxID=2487364 RepID=A0A3S3E0E6_9NOCA|nr:DUF305 domain-containing protein [Rhodococcus xishaensis]RVW03088.1 DUF305 domain-containing protein [Rhodococcus xishaensis]